VAQKVLGKMGKGEKVSIGAIAREVGYSPLTANNPETITNTKSYRDVVEPFVAKMIKERDRIIDAMSRKDLGEVQFNHLTDSVDKLTKNIQLLNGNATEKQVININIDGNANSRYVNTAPDTSDSSAG
jgi:hypothetical protein